MTIERTTKELKLEKANATVVLYSFITGRDKRAIESIYLEEAQITQKVSGEKKGETEIGGITGGITHLMQDATFKVVVKEIIDLESNKAITEKSKILNYLLDLPEEEYNIILEAVNEITDPKKS